MIKQVFPLAFADYLHQWRVSFCFVLALAAVLAPLLILFGLKFGIISSMFDQLVEDPRNREIRPVGSQDYTPEWFAQMRQQDGVAFVIPRTRLLAAGIKLSPLQGGRIINAEMIPSAPGDPSLDQNQPMPKALSEVVVSASVARKLALGAGDQLKGFVSRQHHGKKQRQSVLLDIVAIAPERAFSRDGLFVSLAMITAAENYRDGQAVPALGWDGDVGKVNRDRYPGFRLYAQGLDDVLRLRQALNKSGIEVRTKAADIEVVKSMDRNLSLVFWIIALVGAGGFSLSLGANLWADVDRKRRDLSVLRLVGFQRGDLIWFPVLQGLFTALAGWLLAVVIYLGLEAMINGMFLGKVQEGAEVCRLLPEHHLLALLFTVLSAVVAAALGGFRAGQIEPSDGLREI